MKNLNNKIKPKEICVDLAEEKLEGDVLDVGVDNHGIVYQLCRNEDEVCVDYVGSEDYNLDESGACYDVVVLFFEIGKLNLISERKKLLSKAYDYLKPGGEIIIWDINKKGFNIVNTILKFKLPGNKEKQIYLRDYNLFKDCSRESVKSLIQAKYEIIEIKGDNNIYCIKGRKMTR